MRSQGRMESAVDALKLFIRSLPIGCSFSVKSFGSRFSDMNYQGKANPIIQYSEDTKKSALA